MTTTTSLQWPPRGRRWAQQQQQRRLRLRREKTRATTMTTEEAPVLVARRRDGRRMLQRASGRSLGWPFRCRKLLYRLKTSYFYPLRRRVFSSSGRQLPRLYPSVDSTLDDTRQQRPSRPYSNPSASLISLSQGSLCSLPLPRGEPFVHALAESLRVARRRRRPRSL